MHSSHTCPPSCHQNQTRQEEERQLQAILERVKAREAEEAAAAAGGKAAADANSGGGAPAHTKDAKDDTPPQPPK